MRKLLIILFTLSSVMLFPNYNSIFIENELVINSLKIGDIKFLPNYEVDNNTIGYVAINFKDIFKESIEILNVKLDVSIEGEIKSKYIDYLNSFNNNKPIINIKDNIFDHDFVIKSKHIDKENPYKIFINILINGNQVRFIYGIDLKENISEYYNFSYKEIKNFKNNKMITNYKSENYFIFEKNNDTLKDLSQKEPIMFLFSNSYRDSINEAKDLYKDKNYDKSIKKLYYYFDYTIKEIKDFNTYTIKYFYYLISNGLKKEYDLKKLINLSENVIYQFKNHEFDILDSNINYYGRLYALLGDIYLQIKNYEKATLCYFYSYDIIEINDIILEYHLSKNEQYKNTKYYKMFFYYINYELEKLRFGEF